MISTQGIHHLEDVPLSISEAVGGGASSGTTVVVRLALPFNALTSIAPLPVLVASNSRENSLPPASREEDDGHGQSENYDSNANKSKGCGSKLPTPVVLAPLFLHLTLLDVRHNKCNGNREATVVSVCSSKQIPTSYASLIASSLLRNNALILLSFCVLHVRALPQSATGPSSEELARRERATFSQVLARLRQPQHHKPRAALDAS